MCVVFTLFLSLLILQGCSKSAAEKLYTEYYAELYEAIFARDADRILQFTQHESEYVQRQAWRALINTPIAKPDVYVEEMERSSHEAAWVALSRLQLDREQVNALHDLWKNVPSKRAYISMVLGLQGNESSLDFLIRNFDSIIHQPYEYEAALAIGRLIGRFGIDAASERIIVQHAAIQQNPEIFMAYFYGYYRWGKAITDKRLQEIIRETYNYAEHPEIRQYVIKLDFQNNAENALKAFAPDRIDGMGVQTAVELAHQLGKMEWSPKLGELFTRLLQHQNAVVNEEALNQLKSLKKPDDYDEVLISAIINNAQKETSVKLSGIEALNEISPYIDLVESLASEREYFTLKKLSIYRKSFSNDEFLHYIAEHTNTHNNLELVFTAQVLDDWWKGLPASAKTPERIQMVRDILHGMFRTGNRSVAYMAASLLSDSAISKAFTFSYFEEILQQFALPEDVEVFQAFAGVLKNQFESESAALISSWAQVGNTALNSTLRQQGWEIPQEELTPATFRKPDWKRLVKLGYSPVWVLETNKGTIKIKMNTVIAPVTIAGMDSLITAGAYDGVAFHRVVPNFVVQGGDVESGDGFGGPDYVVPTEASEGDYKRGAVGIASAGIDTEGSQYFIMHQWAPHLNSRYTIVGEVIEGMEVVDRLLVSDFVERSYWQ